MVILSVDTSGSKGSLAVANFDGSKVLALQQVEWTKKAIHSEIATVQLQALLASTGFGLKDLTHLAVNIGPGSFTGLRVGVSLVKTLAYSLGLKVATINSLEGLAFSNTKEGESALVAIRAVQTFFYAAAYAKKNSRLENLVPPQSIDAENLASLSQNCTKVLVDGQTPGFSTESDAETLIQILVESGFSIPFSDWKSVEPLYLRASEAEEKMKKGLLRPL